MLISIAEISYATKPALSKTINQVPAMDNYLDGSGMAAVFSKDLISNLNDGFGYGSCDFSADTDGHQTTLDNYGLIAQCKGYEARFTGSRRVENLIYLSSENLTRGDGGASGWYEADGASALTIVNATTIRTGGEGTLDVLLNKNNVIDGTSRQYSGFMDAIIPDGLTLSLAIQGNGTEYGQYGKVPIIGDGTLHRYVTNLADNIVGGQDWSGGVRFRLEIAGVDNDAQYDIQILKSKFEDVTGKSNSNVSEYVSVGVGTEPQEMLKSNLDGLILNIDYAFIVSTGISYNDDSDRFIFDGGGAFLANIALTTLFPKYENNYTYYAEIDIDNFVHCDSSEANLAFSGIFFPAPTGNGTISVAGRTNAIGGAFSAYQSNIGTGWAIFDITGLRVYKIDHGTKVDGVKCFPTENWNTHNEQIHTIIDRSDYAPQLRQRVAGNIIEDRIDGGTVVIDELSADEFEISNLTTQYGNSIFWLGENLINIEDRRFTSSFELKATISEDVGKTINIRLYRATGGAGSGSPTIPIALSADYKRYSAGDFTGLADNTGVRWFVWAGTSDKCSARRPMIEETTGSLSAYPSEYVSVGIATSVFNVNPNYLKDFISPSWTFDTTSINAPNTSNNVYFFPTESQNDTACYCPFLYKFTVSGMSGANLNVGWLSGSVIKTITTDGDYSINLGVSDSPFLLVLPTFTPSGGLLTCKITNIKLYRVGHGYFGINEDPSVLAFMDGYEGFNTENGNTVVSNKVVAGNGIKITPTDGVFLELERTNLCDESINFSANWSAFGTGTAVDGYGLAPDGSAATTQLIGDGTAGSGVQSPAVPIDYANGAYTSSCYVRNIDSLKSRMGIWNVTDGAYDANVTYDWSVATPEGIPSTNNTAGLGSNIVASYEQMNDDIWRIILTWTPPVTTIATDTTRLLLQPDRDAISRDIEAWGAQVEIGAFASSYIPTVGTALTRTVDTLSCDSVNVPDNNWAITLDWVPKYSSADMIAQLKDRYLISGESSIFIFWYIFYDVSIDRLQFRVSVDGATKSIRLLNPNFIAGQRHKIAIRKTSTGDGISLFLDGTKATDLVGTGDPTANVFIDNFAIGSRAYQDSFDRESDVQESDVTVYKRPLSDAKLQELTS